MKRLLEAVTVTREQETAWKVRYHAAEGAAVERRFRTRGAALAFVRKCRLVPVHKEVRA